jgi:hypothetical protein
MNKKYIVRLADQERTELAAVDRPYAACLFSLARRRAQARGQFRTRPTAPGRYSRGERH